MKSLSTKLGVILFIIGFPIFGNIDVWGAECAWVLWEQRAYYMFEKGEPIERKYREIIGAFPKYEQCLERKKVLFTNTRDGLEKKDKVKTVPFELIIERLSETTSLHYQFICLPDTIDPRK
jgi:hypothetical protein